ncbi:hypothetical protein FIU97_08180 [Roseivivax sp. THAF40]|uniref:DUF4112 domain-containing protein n=1 Tax=unclassified Roseivivax TaxID=2639302 RepID=UPI0012679145|nr:MULTISPECIES: DUF4112 domain-containing protein [unclassified Roseivivax]QFS82775.1 hypothetical protein FIV09_08075 [Roseivivax sp. THAF197b]QFT46544.1 hypothetical protein FIU97_08180 [Roseivivax sp. THAF40]
MSLPDRQGDFDRVDRIERLARTMDRAFRLPGTRIRFGWDSLIGLIPGIGDTVALLPAAYIVATARRMGVPTSLLVKMIWNIVIDWLVGLVPFAGDIFDVGFKSNSKNARLLREHIEARHGAPAGTAPVA